jgi:hypothetical protein
MIVYFDYLKTTINKKLSVPSTRKIVKKAIKDVKNIKSKDVKNIKSTNLK